MVYAGLVYWPLYDHTTIGSILVALIIVGGLIDGTVKYFKGRKALEASSAEKT